MLDGAYYAYISFSPTDPVIGLLPITTALSYSGIEFRYRRIQTVMLTGVASAYSNVPISPARLRALFALQKERLPLLLLLSFFFHFSLALHRN